MASSLNIKWDENELIAIGEEIEARILQATGDTIKLENLKLQQAASRFLTAAVKIIDDIQDYNTLQQKQSILRNKMRQSVPVSENDQQIYDETAQMIRDRFITPGLFNNFFKESMIFNDSILEIITGTPMTTVIVVEKDDGTPEVREYTIKELLEEGSGVKFITDYTSKTHTLMGRIQINTTQLTKAASEISLTEQEKKNFSLSGLNTAYAEAKIDYLKNNPWAFFKPNVQAAWQKIKIAGGLGDISEAYTAFFFLKTYHFKDSLYPNLTVYFVQGVANVDSVSGLYAADVYDEENKRNYAIKAANASLPGYNQMIKLANNILDSTKQWDVAKLREVSEKRQYKIVNGEKVRKGLRNIVEEVFDFMSEYTNS